MHLINQGQNFSPKAENVYSTLWRKKLLSTTVILFKIFDNQNFMQIKLFESENNIKKIMIYYQASNNSQKQDFVKLAYNLLRPCICLFVHDNSMKFARNQHDQNINTFALYLKPGQKYQRYSQTSENSLNCSRDFVTNANVLVTKRKKLVMFVTESVAISSPGKGINLCP